MLHLRETVAKNILYAKEIERKLEESYNLQYKESNI